MIRPGWQAKMIAKEPGSKFLGTPERWLDASPVQMRCDSGHVSTNGLITDRGLLCRAKDCGLPLWITSPEDTEAET